MVRDDRKLYLVSLSVGAVIGGAESKLPLAHMGLLSIAEHQKELGNKISILDGDSEGFSDNEILDILIKGNPLLVGLSPTQTNMHRILTTIRELAKHCPNTTIILGGHHVSFVAKEIIEDNPEVDIVVRGEGEIPFARLVESIFSGEDWKKKKIPGLVYCNGNKILETGKPPVVEMDSLPWIGKCQLDKSGEVALISSRGCQSNCAFCASPGFSRLSQGPCWRIQSPECIVDEIAYLKGMADGRSLSIHFHDPDFLGMNYSGIDRAIKVADLIIKRGIKSDIRFACQAGTARRAGGEFWHLWKKAGLVKVYIGFESGLDSELKRSYKTSTVLDNLAAFEIIRSSGIALQIGFIMLDPYSTGQTILENLSFLAKIDQAHLFKHVASSLNVYPGTAYFHTLHKAGLLEFEKPYLRIRVLYRDSFIQKLEETLSRYRGNQYLQDCLCLDLDFALSIGKTQAQTLGYTIDITPPFISKYRLYRQSRGKLIQSFVRKTLLASHEKLESLVKAFNEQLTLVHREFLQSALLKQKKIERSYSNV